MKKRLINLLFILSLIAVLIAYPVSAYNGLSGISVTTIAENEWFNAGLLFLLIFSITWFILQKVFSASQGAALVISIVLALLGSTGIIYYYGAVAKYFSWWVLALAGLIILVLLYQQLKRQGTVFALILIALSLAWFLYGRANVCLGSAILPANACIIFDAIAAAFVVIAIIKFLLMAKGIAKGKVRDMKTTQKQFEFETRKERMKARIKREENERRRELERARRRP